MAWEDLYKSARQAAKILHKEITEKDIPDDIQGMIRLQSDLWGQVYAQNAKTKTCKVLKIHDDGDATLECSGKKYVVTTEGDIFKEVPKIEEV